MAKIKIVRTPNADEDVENLILSYIACGNLKWYNCSGKKPGSFLSLLNMYFSYDLAIAFLGIYSRQMKLVLVSVLTLQPNM
jgi:hypothetical protein